MGWQIGNDERVFRDTDAGNLPSPEPVIHGRTMEEHDGVAFSLRPVMCAASQGGDRLILHHGSRSSVTIAQEEYPQESYLAMAALGR